MLDAYTSAYFQVLMWHTCRAPYQALCFSDTLMHGDISSGHPRVWRYTRGLFHRSRVGRVLTGLPPPPPARGLLESSDRCRFLSRFLPHALCGPSPSCLNPDFVTVCWQAVPSFFKGNGGSQPVLRFGFRVRKARAYPPGIPDRNGRPPSGGGFFGGGGLAA